MFIAPPAGDLDVRIKNIDFIRGNAADGGNIFVGEGAVVTLVGGTVVMGNANNDGGGVYVGSGATLDLFGTDVTGNSADEGGGVHVAEGATLRLHDAIVGNNTARSGGGIHVDEGVLEATGDTSLVQNTATGGGGAVECWLGQVHLTDDTLVAGNTAASGGGLRSYSPDGWTRIDGDVVLRDNQATSGGAIAHAGPGLEVGPGVLIRDNVADAIGGGIFIDGGGLVEATFDSNTAGQDGGALWVSGTGKDERRLTLSGATFKANHADGEGGGIFAHTVTLQNVWVHDNTATRGGGMALDTAYVSACEEEELPHPESAVWVKIDGAGTAPGSCLRGAVGTDEYCSEFRNNTADDAGGAIYVPPCGLLQLDRTAFIGNDAVQAGAVLYLADAEPGLPKTVAQVQNALLVGNGTGNATLVDVRDGAHLLADHLTIADNESAGVEWQPGSLGFLHRSIVVDSGPVKVQPPKTLDANCTAIDQLLGAAIGHTIVAAPEFVTTVRGDYRIAWTSSAYVNQCTTTLLEDLDSFVRPMGPASDRGAFEAPPGPGG